MHRRAIMKKNNWDNDCSEIMVSDAHTRPVASNPLRRLHLHPPPATPPSTDQHTSAFWKDFFLRASRSNPAVPAPTHTISFHTDFAPSPPPRSIAMFCASMALSYSVTIVVFSPAARGSRSLLERMHDFVNLLGMEDRIISFNQENLKIKAINGGVSLLRSFPSKIEVCHSLPQLHACACVCMCVLSSYVPALCKQRGRSRGRSTRERCFSHPLCFVRAIQR